jgi:hypothetical protein
MRQVILLQIAPGKDGIDRRQACLWTIPHRHRDSAIQLDHG